MARLSLKCACGWTFFLPDSTPGHEVNCPSCQESVPIPGRKPGQHAPQSAGEIAARIQSRQSRFKTLLLGGAGVAVAAGLYFGLATNSKPAPQEDPKNPFSTEGGSAPTPRPAPRPASPGSDLPPPPPPLYTTPQIQDLRHNVFANVWLLNMSAILSECMRYRGLTNDWGQLQANIAIHEGRIKQNLAELAKVGEKVVLEPYLAQGDQIIRFGLKDLTTMKSADAGQVLAFWANNWTPGAALEKVDVLREGAAVSIYLQFPENSTELLTLLRHPAIQPDNPAEPAPGLDPAASGVVISLPADLIKDVNDRFAALPPGYRSLLVPDDRRRLEDLAANRKGSPEDVQWIKSRILGESLPAFQREAEMVRSQVLGLEPKLKENAATDVIYRKNGTKVEGQIVETTDAFVRIKSRFGSVPIPKEEIAKVEKGKGSATEFPAQYAEAKGSLEKLVPLMAWCAEKSLKAEKEFVAYTVLTLDASNERARTAVGLARPAIGSGGKSPGTDETTKTAPGAEKTVAAIAADVLTKSFAFSDVIQEMRRRTDKLTAAQLPIVPESAGKGLSFIQNPLTFDPSKLPATSLLEIGSWWSNLPIEERRQFAAYYGLWCAVMRGRK
jgi:hypothetical protein